MAGPTPANADAYERIVRRDVIPGIEAMQIAGFRHIDLLAHQQVRPPLLKHFQRGRCLIG